MYNNNNNHHHHGLRKINQFNKYSLFFLLVQFDKSLIGCQSSLNLGMTFIACRTGLFGFRGSSSPHTFKWIVCGTTCDIGLERRHYITVIAARNGEFFERIESLGQGLAVIVGFGGV